MGRKRWVSSFWGVHPLNLLAHAAVILIVKCSDVAAEHESNGGLADAPVQVQIHEQADTETTPPPLQTVVSSAQASAETASSAGDVYLLQNRGEKLIQRVEAPHMSPPGAGRLATTGLLASLLVLIGLVFWEVFNFVGDVHDPFKDVTDPGLIPVMIDDMLDKGKSFAFVVRRCKFCGIGIRALKKAGKDTVVVMVEGHPHQTAISRCLRTRYGARGFPFFIVDSDRYGYLSKVKQFLAEESPR